VKIAAIQHDIVWEQGEATRQHVATMIADAAGQGARLVVLTEMYATGFSMRPERIAEARGGPNEQFLIDQAVEHRCWVVGSIAQWPDERDQPGPAERRLAQNVAVLAGPDGSVHRYAKIHPFSYAGEHLKYAPGAEFCTVEVEGLRVSLFVCYDLRFADEFWAVGPDTDLFVVVANWPEVRREHWRALLVARAIENQTYVIGVNRVGLVKELNYVGDSAVIDPMGERLVERTGSEGVLVAEVTPERVAQVRAQFPFLADRR
jgi:predicted amidohydrolase